MKKYFIITLVLIITLGLVSCKKDIVDDKKLDEIDYHFSGLYLELINDSSYAIDGMNPCIYYNHKKEVFGNWKGLNFEIGPITAENISKNIYEENSTKITKLHISFIFPSNVPKKVKIYIVTENLDGKLIVNQNNFEEIDLSEHGSYTLSRRYKIESQKYWFQLTFGYYIKEV